ncbi:MAG: phosphoesterase, PA-phosphatase related [Myxococcales bacterium]|nr:phosphoesterase, PA-phosphatase related [Myxococcales bacterium]
MNLAIRRWLPAPALRTLVLFAIAALASLAFVLLAEEVHEGAADRIDLAAALAVHRFESTVGDAMMEAASFIGSYTVVIPVVVLTSALAIRQRRRRAAVILALDTVAVAIANWLLKIYFSRQRPTLFDKIPLPKSFSFPSGHSMCAMGIYGAVAAVLISLYPRARITVLIVTTLLVATIGISRIYLGVHWPLDVVAGFIGGVPPLMVAVYLLHRTSAPRTTSPPP